MSLLLPNPSDPLSNPDHAFLHRIVAIDSAAPEQSITIDATGVNKLPITPVLKGTITINSPDYIQIVGKFLYAVSYVSSLFNIYDVENPANPLLISSSATGNNPAYLYISGRYAYISCTTAKTFEVWDISNSYTPVKKSSTAFGSGTPKNLQIVGNYLYIADSADGLYVFDISIPTAPVKMYNSTGSPLHQVFVSGRYVYGIDTGNSTFKVWDAADPRNISAPITNVSIVNIGMPLAVIGKYAYVIQHTTSDTFQVYNISNPLSPTLVGTLTGITGAWPNSQMCVSGRYAYVLGDLGNLLYIIDVSVPTAPTLAASIATDSSPRNIAVEGRYVYIGAYTTSTIKIYDLSGLDINTANIHQLYSGDINVRGSVKILDKLNVVNGVNVGIHGLFSDGDIRSASRMYAPYFEQKVGANVASATSITPTAGIFHVTGTTTIQTIVIPYVGFCGSITIIPDGIFDLGISDNIALAAISVVGKALIMTYDVGTTKWYPSY